MLAKRLSALPDGAGWIFEPKWDGFRTLVFRDGDELLLQSRDEKPLDIAHGMPRSRFECRDGSGAA